MDEFNPVFVPKTDAQELGGTGCPHNKGVNCKGPTKEPCQKCGWNPAVHDLRVKKLRARGQADVQQERNGAATQGEWMGWMKDWWKVYYRKPEQRQEGTGK